MYLVTRILVWMIAILASLVALNNKEPLDRLRIYNLWGGGIMIWALTYERFSPTQIAAGIVLADAAMSFVLIGVIVAARAAKAVRDRDKE